jgi:hypothetical protein
MFLCILGLLFALRYLVAVFYDYPDVVADISPIGALLTLPLFFRYCSYIYDPATLFLFPMALILIVKKKYLLFYLVFILATCNRETSILLAGLFFLYNLKRMPKSRLVGHACGQAIIWFSIKMLLVNIFRSNPGSFLEFHLFDRNLALFRQPISLLYFTGVILLFTPLIFYKWKSKPVFLRWSFLLTMGTLFSIGFVWGVIDELRVYYEAFPFIFLLSLPTVVEVLGSKVPSCGTLVPLT